MNGQLSVGTATSEWSTRWDDFVEVSEPGDLCRRYSWKSVFESTYGLPCEYLFAEQDGSLVGILPLVEVAGIFTGKRLVSLPFLDQGGIIAKDEEVAAELLSTAIRLGGSRGMTGIDLRGGSYPIDGRSRGTVVQDRWQGEESDSQIREVRARDRT